MAAVRSEAVVIRGVREPVINAGGAELTFKADAFAVVGVEDAAYGGVAVEEVVVVVPALAVWAGTSLA